MSSSSDTVLRSMKLLALFWLEKKIENEMENGKDLSVLQAVELEKNLVHFFNIMQ